MLKVGSITTDARKPEGSEQLATVVSDQAMLGSTAGTGAVHKGGVSGAADALIQVSSNLALASSVDSAVWAANMVCWLLCGGKMFKNKMALNVVQPAVLDDWPVGLFRVDGVFNWAVANPAGVDSGLCFYLANGIGTMPNAVVGGAADGIMLYNDGGALKFFSRGNGRTETVTIDSKFFGNTLTDWTRLALEFRQARKTAPADVRAYVNGQLVLQRKYTGAHALPLPAAAATGWLHAAIVHRVSSTTQGIRYAHVNVAMGPDSDGV